jgi:hypothetical protein
MNVSLKTGCMIQFYSPTVTCGEKAVLFYVIFLAVIFIFWVHAERVPWKNTLKCLYKDKGYPRIRDQKVPNIIANIKDSIFIHVCVCVCVCVCARARARALLINYVLSPLSTAFALPLASLTV